MTDLDQKALAQRNYDDAMRSRPMLDMLNAAEAAEAHDAGISAVKRALISDAEEAAWFKERSDAIFCDPPRVSRAAPMIEPGMMRPGQVFCFDENGQHDPGYFARLVAEVAAQKERDLEGILRCDGCGGVQFEGCDDGLACVTCDMIVPHDKMLAAMHRASAAMIIQPLAASEETQEKGSMENNYEGRSPLSSFATASPRMVGADRNTVATQAGTLTAAVARLEMTMHTIVGLGHRAHEIANALGGPIPEDDAKSGPVGVPTAINAQIHALLDRIEIELARVSAGHRRCETLVGRSADEATASLRP